ncbi:phage conserved hypothetical protein, phiE125 gp8 family [Marininema mesophilum]|uniref:Phage gp6-like head-tail connector protein n=1 Tax=Marininema mesophilum TaxID=1048340 RepID=A0A1H3BU33_9BACL|nr:head-tail connector protein [Marininema mesophilum]SDX45168.1 phage conserved hypothetical protein, phiE125 gp8 family [Marininema mesophilum]
MGLRRLTPPKEEPLTLEEAKAHLRIDGNDEDSHISGLIGAAREHAESITQRAFLTQTHQLSLNGCPDEALLLPKPPIQLVQKLQYIDPLGKAQILKEGADFWTDSTTEPSRIVPIAGWPATASRPGAVVIDFVSGYGESNDVPQPIKQAMLLMIGHWYEHREAVSETSMTTLPLAVDALLNPYRIWRYI